LAQCIYDQAEQEKQIQELINDIAMPWIENPEQYSCTVSLIEST